MWRSVLMFLLVAAGAGCTTTSAITLTADQSKVPILFTEGFYDAGHRLVLNEGYDRVHQFTLSYSKTTWGLFSRSKAETIDLSRELDALVRTHKGDAIVNLQAVGGNAAGIDLLRFFVGVLTFGLFLPEKVMVTVQGDIVRLAAPGAPVDPLAAGSP